MEIINNVTAGIKYKISQRRMHLKSEPRIETEMKASQNQLQMTEHNMNASNKGMSKKPYSKITSKVTKKTKKDPHRPIKARSAYNFFYQFQRKMIMDSMFSMETVDEDESELLKIIDPKKKDTIEIHAELRAQFNRFFGNASTTRKKRPHRKTHGKIEMQTLTKLVALRWKNANNDVRSFFQIEADKDSHRYRADMRTYDKSLKEKALQEDIALEQNSSSAEATAQSCHLYPQNFLLNKKNMESQEKNTGQPKVPEACVVNCYQDYQKRNSGNEAKFILEQTPKQVASSLYHLIEGNSTKVTPEFVSSCSRGA